MDENKMMLLVAGVHLGDISLALAGVSEELPAYVDGLDFERLLADAENQGEIRKRVEQGLGGKTEAGELPQPLIREILEAAVSRGKFLSAGRCLDMLGEREAYVDRYLAKAVSKAGDGKPEEAAKAFTIAGNLEFSEGLPLFQYSGPALHDACATSPDSCVTRLPEENAVLKAMKYLLETDKVYEAAAQLAPDIRVAMLPHLVLERDPRAREFFAALETAHNDLVDAEEHAIAELRSRVAEVAGEVGKFAASMGALSTKDETGRGILERVARTAAGLVKEFTDACELVDALQLRRLSSRLEQLIESDSDLEAARKTLGGEGTSAAVFDAMRKLIQDLKDKNVLGQVGDIERRLLSAQATMLGRSVHSQEHWQYMRELAFKYPSSPLMCCLRRINDRWMVVPMWDSPIATILRPHLAS